MCLQFYARDNWNKCKEEGIDMKKLKELRDECLELQHQLWLEGKTDSLLRAYQIATDAAEKASQKPFILEDYQRLLDRVFDKAH